MVPYTNNFHQWKTLVPFSNLFAPLQLPLSSLVQRLIAYSSDTKSNKPGSSILPVSPTSLTIRSCYPVQLGTFMMRPTHHTRHSCHVYSTRVSRVAASAQATASYSSALLLFTGRFQARRQWSSDRDSKTGFPSIFLSENQHGCSMIVPNSTSYQSADQFWALKDRR